MAKRKGTNNAVDTASDRSSKLPTDGTAQVSEHEIAERAYALYLARDLQPGHELEDWFQAERELREALRSTP